VEDPMTFDEALDNLLGRFEHIVTLPMEEQAAYARDSAEIEKDYPNGLVSRMARAARDFNRAEGAKSMFPGTKKDLKDPRIRRICELTQQAKAGLVK